MKPDQKLALPNTLSNLQAMLDNSGIMNEKAPCFGEASADDYWVPDATLNALPQQYQNVYKWQSTEDDFPAFPDDWSNLYNTVYYSNVVLDNIQSINRTRENLYEWDNIKGSALFYRAYSFLKIAWIYALGYDKDANNNPGIVLRLSSDFNTPSIRSDLAATYDQIKKDINEAINLLPINSKSPMRPSKPAAYALMARFYLSTRNYELMGKYADSCLQLYSTLVDYNDIATPLSPTPFPRFNKEVIYHQRIGTFTISLIAPTLSRMDTLLIHQYDSSDLRKSIFFGYVKDNEFRFKGNYDGTPYNLFTGIAVDEVLLMRAEAYARQEETDKALADLNFLMVNRIRESEFTPITNVKSEELLNLILMERRKELLFRGLRWIDIKRLNLDQANITLTRRVNGNIISLTPNNKRFALPIPKTIIQETGIPQNVY